MEFKISRQSLSDTCNPRIEGAYKAKDGYWYIKINSIEELVEIQKNVHNWLVIAEGEIIVYDDYME